ncbi:hypothetical protein ACFFIO_05440 [Citricoccus parietis]|uniref:Uncharacterized protein n=1 Tax=Citricoccus parietis TaxID=592307 RepID=A0ABV6F3G8_9MICC
MTVQAWRQRRWDGIEFDTPESWADVPGETFRMMHPERSDLAYRPTFTARVIHPQGRSLTQVASLTAAFNSSALGASHWVDAAPSRLSSPRGLIAGRRMVFLHESPVGDLVTYSWAYVLDEERLVEMNAHCTVFQSIDLRPLLLHLGDTARWEGAA